MERAPTASALLEPDLEFHRAIMATTHNDLLAHIGNMLSLALSESIKLMSRHPDTHALSLLRAENIVKRFRAVAALDGVTLTLKQGEILGVLGNNGAGKSTFIKILTGFQRQTSGKLFVRGEETLLRSVDHAWPVLRFRQKFVTLDRVSLPALAASEYRQPDIRSASLTIFPQTMCRFSRLDLNNNVSPLGDRRLFVC